MIRTLELQNLSFQYYGHKPTFENLSYEMPMGQIVRINAESGSGRSTFLQILAGLQMPTSGRYLINGHSISDMSFEEFLRYRLQIGYGFDFGGLLHNRTIYENLMLPLMYHKILSQEQAHERVEQYMERTQILKYKDQRPSVVQGGVRKMACLLRAVMHHPEVLILDDPSIGLNQEVVTSYFAIVKELCKQGSVKNIFLTSFDDKLMNSFEHTELFVEHSRIHQDFNTGFKKVVSL